MFYFFRIFILNVVLKKNVLEIELDDVLTVLYLTVDDVLN